MFSAILAWLKSPLGLDMICLDSGMFLFKDYPDAMTALRACYTQAFDDAYDENDVTVLLEE